MGKRPIETTKQFLISSPLPTHGKKYTVVPHGDVLKFTHEALSDNNFTIEKELYRANINAQIAQGVYYIKNNLDNDLSMMFGWTNSYDRSLRFQCAVGGYVMVCSNCIVSGDMLNFARKHTGNALDEIKKQIESQVKHANKFFQNLIIDKNNLRLIDLSIKEQSELLGRLYFDERLLDVSQMSCIKSEMKEPSFDYQADMDNAWTFYNHVTHALKKSHPRTWLTDQQKFHNFIVANVLSKMGIKKMDTVNSDDIINQDFQSNLGLEEQWDQQTRIEEGLDYKGEFPEHNPVSLRVRDGQIEQFDDETGEIVRNEALDNTANED